MNRLTTIDYQSIPPIITGCHLSPTIAEILDAMKNLHSNRAVRYQCDDNEQAKKLKVSLIYHFNKRHRPGTPTMPNIRACQRHNVVFIWLEGE